ncbi:MAG TPA: ATP-binding protein [Geodermatophilus sp.]|nr:ATP-binding protein [Geodermatophilus sp.]
MSTELAPVAAADTERRPRGRGRPRPRRPLRARRPPRPRRELGVFLLSALLVLLVVSAGTVWLSEHVARQNALDDAQRSAEGLAERLVAPLLSDALAGTPERWEELDRDLGHRMGDGSITSVVVWTADGRVLYASDDEVPPDRLPPPEELPAAFAGETIADVDHRPEPAGDGVGGTPVLEVLVPLTVRGDPLAVQAFFSYEGIDRQAASLRQAFIPLSIGALVVLQLVQIPIAASLARRVRRQESERAELMARAVEASDRERRAIAADVHDGPVQDLAGVSYALSALRASVPPERQPTVDRLVGAVRHAVQSLRRLMVDIYPPELSGPGLVTAVQDLAEPLRDQGVDVTVDAAPLPAMGPDAAAALYRTAKEALANAGKHAGAGHVWVTLEPAAHPDVPAVRLEIADDGVGFPVSGTDRRREGHLGLRLVRDRIEDLGGSLDLGARPGGGAVMTAVVPAGAQG